MTVGELFAGLSRGGGEYTQPCPEALGRSRDPTRPVWGERQTHRKGVATAKLRDLAIVKYDIVVKRLGITSERGKG